MFGIRHRLAVACYQGWLRYYQWRNPQVRFGNNVRLKGLPIFAIAPSANVTIGNDVTFISHPAANLVGLSKRCSLAADSEARLAIGEGSGFSGVSIYCTTEIVIGQFLVCGGNVSIWDTDFHPLDYAARRRNDRGAIVRKPVRIGDDVFLGAQVIVLKGVQVGDRAVVAAGSVVTRDIPADEIWGGNPARFLKKTDQPRPAILENPPTA
ncbi:MAG: acyltransferase [Verrucomicrobia bacterium]|nr:acyltransferase [Verrucomicrobiota bacterium]